MKTFHLVLALICCLTACDQQKTGSKKKGEISIFDNTKSQINDSLKTTDSIAIVAMKKQLILYHDAFLSGNGDAAIKYCLPEMFLYFENEYPNQSKDELKDFLIRTASENFKKQIDENEMKYEFEIKEIEKVLEWDENKVYVVTTFINIIKDLEKRGSGDKILAISEDDGINWKFIQKENESVRPILKMIYPNSKVNQILK